MEYKKFNVIQVPPAGIDVAFPEPEAAGIDKLCLLDELPIRLTGKTRKEAGSNGLLMRILDDSPDKVFGYIRVNPRNTGEVLPERGGCRD